MCPPRVIRHASDCPAAYGYFYRRVSFIVLPSSGPANVFFVAPGRGISNHSARRVPGIRPVFYRRLMLFVPTPGAPRYFFVLHTTVMSTFVVSPACSYYRSSVPRLRAPRLHTQACPVADPAAATSAPSIRLLWACLVPVCALSKSRWSCIIRCTKDELPIDLDQSGYLMIQKQHPKT